MHVYQQNSKEREGISLFLVGFLSFFQIIESKQPFIEVTEGKN